MSVAKVQMVAQHGKWYVDSEKDQIQLDIKAHRELLAGLGCELTETKGDRAREYRFSFTAPVDLAIDLQNSGIESKFEYSIDKLLRSFGSGIVASTENARATNPSEANWNSKVEVHTPGHAMSLYNEVLLLEDDCTDNLQTTLNQGWRLLAVCPQPDSRRPDYILGRFNPYFEGYGTARRKDDTVECRMGPGEARKNAETGIDVNVLAAAMCAEFERRGGIPGLPQVVVPRPVEIGTAMEAELFGDPEAPRQPKELAVSAPQNDYPVTSDNDLPF